MKLFVRNIILFAILTSFLFVIVFKIAGNCLENDRYFSIPPDKSVLVLGHSHAAVGINPEFVPRLVNLCNPGESYYFSYVKLRQVLKSNNRVKIVLVEYSNNQVTNETKKWIFSDNFLDEHYPKYMGFLTTDEKIYLFRKNPVHFFSLEAMALKRELSFLLTPATDKNFMKQNKWGSYIRLDVNKTDSLLAQISKEKEETIDNRVTGNIDYLKKIHELCKSKHLTLILIRSPLHPKYRIDATEYEFKRILREELPDVRFADFKDYPIQPDEFADLHHLNYKGALKYSKAIDSLIKVTEISGSKQVLLDK